MKKMKRKKLQRLFAERGDLIDEYVVVMDDLYGIVDQKNEEIEMVKLYNDLEREAIVQWWRTKRPEGWSMEAHINEPFVHCNDAERKLAAIGARIEAARNMLEDEKDDGSPD